jgi:hypothetical protein
MATQQASVRRFRFSLKILLAIVTVVPILAGLFWPRFGPPLDGCVGKGDESVWIAPPDRAEVIAKCKAEYPELVLPPDPPIVIEKVFEDVTACSFFNFQGRRLLHRVRYRCEIYVTEVYPPETVVVLIDYDHYHLNGGGGEPVHAK